MQQADLFCGQTELGPFGAIKEGHSPQMVMQSAMGDLKAMGNLSGLIAIMQTGQFNPQQMVLAERLAGKIIAYCALSKK